MIGYWRAGFMIVLGGWLLAGVTGCIHLNAFPRDGALALPGLRSTVQVARDGQGMAYIHAGHEEDLLRAQGFVTAQDRLFQMELTRLFVSGRISELVGPAGRESDIRMRTIGFVRHARRHAEILNGETRRFLQNYLDGVNAFIAAGAGIPLEYRLSGLRPEPWTIADSLAVIYFMGWGSAANLKDEIIAQMLVETLGPERAETLFPLNVNPDDKESNRPAGRSDRTSTTRRQRLDLASDPALTALLADVHGGFHLGSNNWVVGAPLSASGKPTVVNDPHLDPRVLPGTWYPCGLILPSLRAVGVTVPGVPGMIIGRTSHIALGVTNAYGDAQDLYIETVDPANPERYLEGGRSVAFETLTETLRIRDKQSAGGFREETFRIRLTKRGPVVSGLLKGLDATKVFTLRWSPFEAMEPSLGVEKLWKARNVQEIRDALRPVTTIMLNFVFADMDGRFGWQTTGRLPVRSRGDGLVPLPVTDGRDDWTGWIPYEQMPQAYDPPRGWVGTANHYAVTGKHSYYYTSHASPSYRYRRLIELLDAPGKKTAEDHWRFQRDWVNLMARQIAPPMARALLAHPDTKTLGEILLRWDFADDPNQAAPAVFQAVYRQFFLAALRDELGEPLARAMIDNPYFWQERLNAMIAGGESPWFDDRSTPAYRETRDDLLHRAARAAIAELSPLYGPDPAEWRWGRMHRLILVSPLRREGFGRDLLGSGPLPMGGSQETLHRASFDYNRPFDVVTSASLRMVADLGDPEKILAVLPGGVSARLFDPHFRDQVAPFMSGEPRFWWFSDEAIRRNAKTRQILTP